MIQNCASARTFLAVDLILKYSHFLPNCCSRGIPMLQLHVVILFFFNLENAGRANVSEMLLKERKEMLIQMTF